MRQAQLLYRAKSADLHNDAICGLWIVSSSPIIRSEGNILGMKKKILQNIENFTIKGLKFHFKSVTLINEKLA